MAGNNPINSAPVESWKIEDVKPYSKNNKKHPKEQIEALAKSISDQGLNDPITVDIDGFIISGHGRLEAVKLLGWTHVPVRHLKALTKNQADKLRIAANKTTGTDFDIEVLQGELERLAALGEDLTDIGLDDRELDVMLSDLGEMNDASISTDIEADVDAFDDEVDQTAKNLAEKEIPLAKAFGVKTLPLKQQAVVSRFMARIEAATGKTGAEALIAHMETITHD